MQQVCPSFFPIRKFKLLPLLAMALLLTGCVTTALVNPGVATLGGIKLETSQSWTVGESDGIKYWTRDGILLNKISVQRIRNGKHILGTQLDRTAKEEEWQLPTPGDFIWTPDMSLETSMQLHINALSAGRLLDVTLISSRLSTIEDYPAIVFEFAYELESNLRYRALAKFVIKDQALYKIILVAPEQRYFEKLESEFRKIRRSAKF